MSKHTATPWRIGDAGTTVFGPPNGNPSPEIVALAPHVTNVYKGAIAKANIVHIVHCVNTHQALVDALEAIVSYRDNVGALGFQLEKLDDYLNSAREALRQAKEREV